MRNTAIELKSLILYAIDLVLCLSKWFYYSFTRGKYDNFVCLVGKTAIVTGGSSGIGLGAATLLASRGCRVIIADKVVSEEAKQHIIEQTQNSNIILKYVDLSSNKSIREFAEEIRKSEEKIDILMNIAGIAHSNKKSSEDGNNYVMQINYFGSFLLTHLLIDQLKASNSARVVFASSVLAFTHSLSVVNLNITEYENDGSYTRMLYSNSKLCDIIAAQQFAKMLEEKYGIYVFSIDPGTTRTPIYKNQGQELQGGWWRKLTLEFLLIFGTDTYMAAKSAFDVATLAKNKLKNGNHYYRSKPFMKPNICYDKKICDEIWKKSEEIVQLKPEEKI